MKNEFIDFYPFNLANSVYPELASQITAQGIENALTTLTEREARVLEMRFKKGMTLKACGEVFGVGQERIRQIQAKAARKMRHPSRRNLCVSVPLSDYKTINIKHLELQDRYEQLSQAFEGLTQQSGEPQTIMSMAKYFTGVRMPISELDFSVRTHNCLVRAGKQTIKDVAEMTVADLMKVRNMGRRGVEEVISVMKAAGFLIRGTEEEG